eukprot:1180426-Prymnesium_polylepis.1
MPPGSLRKHEPSHAAARVDTSRESCFCIRRPNCSTQNTSSQRSTANAVCWTARAGACDGQTMAAGTAAAAYASRSPSARTGRPSAAGDADAS